MATVYQVEYKIKGVDDTCNAFIAIGNDIFNEMFQSKIYPHQFHNELENIIKVKICGSLNNNTISNDVIVGKMMVLYKK